MSEHSKPHHHLAVNGVVGPLTLAADLTFAAPWTVLFGPSGSGKTSLLRAFCGLLEDVTVSAERFTTDGKIEVLESPTASLPLHARQLAYAPQRPSLFPHLSVYDNVAFATTAANSPGANDAVQCALTLFRLHSLVTRMPAQLSGGEQRVNLARAFTVPHTRLMLLDEPFNGIDRTLRDEILPHMLAEIKTRELAVISVTHDVEEAFLLNAEIVAIREGHVEAQGHVNEVLANERQRALTNLAAPTAT